MTNKHNGPINYAFIGVTLFVLFD